MRVQDGLQYGDLPQYVHFDYIARVARVNAAALASPARAPAAPKNARNITANLTNDTTLRWSASPEPDAAGCEIVWRNTDEPRSDAHDPGRQRDRLHGQGHVEDNFFFGVRAIDRDGHRSPVAFPVPASR